jgi:hypothetical protein
MLGRFERRRSRYSEAVEQATSALENIRGRFGRSKTKHGGRTYDGAVGLGIGALLVVGILIALLLRLLRRTEREGGATEDLGRVNRLKSAARHLLTRERQRADAAEQEANQLRDQLEEERKP